MTAGLARIARAAHAAALAHAHQRRKGPDGAPYINHPLEVAAEVAAAGAGEAAVIAALLHDVVEDTDWDLSQVAARFGAEAAELVAALTDAPDWEDLPAAERKARQAEHIAAAPAAARRIKIADQTANLRDRRASPEAWPAAALRTYLDGARKVARAAAGVDPWLEARFEAAADDLERALAEGAGPRLRGLEGPACAPDLDAEARARARFAAAALYAARRHAGQRRKGAAAEPYVNHVLEVAARLGESRPDDDLLLRAAVLHDVVEDTCATCAELSARFGPEVAALVGEVTDDKALPKAERKRLQVACAPDKSAAARRLKLADLAANTASLVADPPRDWPQERRLAYLDWARRVAEGCRGADAALAAAFDAAAAELDSRLESDAAADA